MHWITPYSIHFFILIISLTIIYFKGNLLINIFFPSIIREKPFYVIFFSLLAGFLCSITLFSLIKTKGATINILIVLLLCFLLYQYYVAGKRKFQFSLSSVSIYVPSFKNLLGLFGVLLVVYSYESFFVLQNEAFPFVIPFFDVLHYADLAEGLNRFGQENRFNTYVLYDEIYKGASLYHFSELWFSALISAVFHISALTSLLLITNNVLIFILISGFIALFENYFKISFYHYFIALLLLFCGGLYLQLYDNWPFLSINFIGDSFPLSFLSRKLLIVYVLLIAFVHLVISRRFNYALIVVWFLIPMYPTTLFGVIGGTALILFIFILFRKFILKKIDFNFNPLRFSVYLTVLIICVLVFNYLTSSQADIRSVKTSGSGFFQQFNVRTSVILFVETWVRLFAYYWLYLPILIALWFIKKEKNIQSSLWFGFLFLLGGGVAALMFSILNHPKMNYWQAFYNFFLPVLSVSLTTLIIITWHLIHKRGLRMLFFIYVALLCIYQFAGITCFNIHFKNNKTEKFFVKTEYDDSYILNINKLFENSLWKSYGIQLSGKKILLSGYGDYIAPFLSFNKNFITPINLSTFADELIFEDLSLTAQEFVDIHPFYRFIQKSKADGTFRNTDEEMLKFVLHFDFISYMIVAKDVEVFPPLEDLFELYAVDVISGERFYIKRNILISNPSN